MSQSDNGATTFNFLVFGSKVSIPLSNCLLGPGEHETVSLEDLFKLVLYKNIFKISFQTGMHCLPEYM